MLLFSSKGKNKYRVMFLGVGILFLIVGVIFAVTTAPSPFADESQKMMYLLSTVVTMVFGIFAILFAFVHCSGYVEIYEDRVEGKGLQGKGMNTFYLNRNQIKSITQESYYLCLHTDIGVFKIICDKDSRMKAMRILKSM